MGLDSTVQLMSQQQISVTVVVPVFNNSNTILRALNSVKQQTATAHEIIIVDDASTDGSLEVITEWAKAMTQVQVFKSAINRGPSVARNTGWDRATSDFVAFLDADDTWHPEKLRIQFDYMMSNPTCVISGHKYQVLSDADSPVDILEKTNSVEQFTMRHFLRKNRFSTPTVMLRRIISQRFDESQRFSEDYQLWLRIIAAYNSGDFLNLPLTYLYKQTFGVSGNSSRMLSMFRGELNNARVLRNESIITEPTVIFWRIWLSAKFVIRLIVLPWRRWNW